MTVINKNSLKTGNMNNIFTDHPNFGEKCWGYCEHGIFTVKCSIKGLIASLCGFVHAIFPFLFPDTSANLYIDIYMSIEKAGRYNDEISEARHPHKFHDSPL